MVADADVPAAVLTQVAATLVTARFWDSWLAVRASRPASPRPGKTDWTCQALWVVELGPGGQQRLARYHEDIVVIPGVGGAVDVDRTLSLLTEPAWSTSAVSLMTTEGVRTQEVATVLAEVPARAPGQVGVSLGRFPPTATEIVLRKRSLRGTSSQRRSVGISTGVRG